MQDILRETTPVEYSAAAVKVLHFKHGPHAGCFRLHWHDRVEVIRVKKGKLVLEGYKNAFALHEGEMTIFAPWKPHKGYTGEEDVEYDVLMFDLRMFYNQTAVCSRLFPAMLDGSAEFDHVITDQETVSCMDGICNHTDPDSLETVSLIYKFLYLLFHKHLYKISPKPDSSVKRIIHYIEENYMLDITTATLSEICGYSTEYFCRKFKEATGIPPMTYLRIYRLEQSLAMIRSGEYRINEIALKCGFGDANYFTRCFKSHYGAAPKRYQNKNGSA